MSTGTNRDVVSGIRAVNAVAAVAITGTVTGLAVDLTNATLQASTGVAFVVNTGVFSGGLDGSEFLTVTFQKSVDSAFTVPVAVPSTDIYGALRADATAWDLLLDNVADESTAFRVGLRIDPGFGFVRIVLTETGTVVGVISATAIVSPEDQPEA